MGALNIKDAAVAAKARKLARLKGTSITHAVDQAIEDSLKAIAPKAAAKSELRERRVDDIVKRFRARLNPGADTPQTIIAGLYDKHGAPR